LVYIPKKDSSFIFESEDDICCKHKKGGMDHTSIKLETKSKSMSPHHGFRNYVYILILTQYRKIRKELSQKRPLFIIASFIVVSAFDDDKQRNFDLNNETAY
jgi:hypothetical protein